MTTHPLIPEHFSHNLYFDRTFGLEAAKVLPGEYFVTTTNVVLVTVLGSCVSACIRDRTNGIGGMNHFMLADTERNGDLFSASARYGTYAMEVLINHLLKLGAKRQNFEAKLFGGGRVIESLSNSMVGDRNVQFARQYLETEGITLVSSDLLDIYPRKVYFFPATGRVLVKKLLRTHNSTLERREKTYAARLNGEPVSGEIELF
jgi:chemotaxis protein CheD